eukprot:632027_1
MAKKKEDTTNRYKLVGVSNTFMKLPMKNNHRSLNLNGRGRKPGKPYSISCPTKDDDGDIIDLWTKFKKQYKENLDDEIDKILAYSKATDRRQAINAEWKRKKAHWKGQTTDQRKLNKEYYQIKWKQLIDIVEAHRKAHPKTDNKKTIKKRVKKQKKQNANANNRTIYASNPNNSTVCNRIQNPATVVVDPRSNAVHLILPADAVLPMQITVSIGDDTPPYHVFLPTSNIESMFNEIRGYHKESMNHMTQLEHSVDTGFEKSEASQKRILKIKSTKQHMSTPSPCTPSHRHNNTNAAKNSEDDDSDKDSEDDTESGSDDDGCYVYRNTNNKKAVDVDRNKNHKNKACDEPAPRKKQKTSHK